MASPTLPSIQLPATSEPAPLASPDPMESSSDYSPSLGGSVRGSISGPSSRSRSSSPWPDTDSAGEKAPAGLLSDAVYRRLLSPWRYSMRARLLRSLGREMHILPRIQSACRTPHLDRLMVYSSWLGSHTFFMCFLPLCFWFGFSRFGASAVYILASGVYFTGCLKDYMCIPRPYAPPLVRLSIGSHAAEYGFPSTHSATSIGSALFVMEQIWPSVDDPAPLHAVFVGVVSGLVMIYIVMLVFGRLYCGMHSLLDVFVGSAIGVAIWIAHALLSPFLYDWVYADTSAGANLFVPVLTTLLGLFMISAHAQPVDDCPCFEDSTAFISTAMGINIGIWAEHTIPGPERAAIYASENLSAEWRAALFAAAAVGKVIVGLAGIFAWRMAAKSVLQTILPPIFRLVVPLFNLPRRHYVPATDYDKYDKETDPTIVPSVVDLPSLAETRQATALHPNLQNRRPGALAVDPLVRRRDKKTKEASQEAPSQDGEDGDPPAHYDVDVLIRVIVYGGIGFMAAYVQPAFFRFVGLL